MAIKTLKLKINFNLISTMALASLPKTSTNRTAIASNSPQSGSTSTMVTLNDSHSSVVKPNSVSVGNLIAIFCHASSALSNYLDLPIAHAWLLTSNGEVIAPTWEKEALAYYGVAFRFQWIKALIKSRQKRGRKNDISIFEGNPKRGILALKRWIT